MVTINLTVPEGSEINEAHRTAQVVDVSLLTAFNQTAYFCSNYTAKGNERFSRSFSYKGIEVMIEFRATDNRVEYSRITVKPDVPRIGIDPADEPTVKRVAGQVQKVLSQNGVDFIVN